MPHDDSPKSGATPRQLVATVAVAAGVAGMVADGLIARKLLVECLPYKEMTHPPSTVYALIGHSATPALLVIAAPVVLALRRRFLYMVPLVLTIVPPFAVLAVLALANVWYGPSPAYAPAFTGTAAVREFAIMGGVPGAIIFGVAAFITVLIRPGRESLGA
jgi:hypothetical protein